MPVHYVEQLLVPRGKGYMVRQCLRVAIRYGSAPTLGGQLLLLLAPVAAGMPRIFRHVGATLTRRRAVAGSLFALAALLAMPMVAAPHGKHGNHQHDCAPHEDSHVSSSMDEFFPYCHRPAFTSPADVTINYPGEHPGAGQPIHALPYAENLDNETGVSPLYRLWPREGSDLYKKDGCTDIIDGTGDAEHFYLVKKSPNLELRASTDGEMDQKTYHLILVACDNSCQREYLNVTVHFGSNGGNGNGGNGNGGNGNGGNGNGGNGNGGNGNGGNGNGGPPPNTVPVFSDSPDTIAVTIAVNDVPVFADSATTRSFPENTPPGHNIGPPVAAEDAEGEPLTYALESADATSFDIEPATGQLKTKSGVSYDHETRPSYSVTVRATDPHDASDVIVVIINVTNVPEKPATPAAPTVSAPDGSITTLLATWTAPDLNGGPSLTGYDVQYRQGIDGVWTDWPHTGTDTTTTITPLAAGTDYQVRVRALGEIPSDWSPPASGRTGNVTVNDWVERFGRSIAQQMIEGVQDRLASPCRTGLQGALAGYRFDGDGRGRAGLLERPWIADDAAAMRLGARDSVSAMGPALLAGTEFELAGETTGGGIACVWGRGAYSSFHGREGQFSLDGNVTTGTLGADYQSGSWTVGVALSHSRGEGRDSSHDDIEAALTGFFPYAGYQITKRLSVWGLGGFGRGGLTVTPPNGTAKETDMGLLMIAAGARSLLLTAPRGMNVAFETDGFWVHAASDGTSGLSATKSDAKRLRFGLESSYRVALKYGGTLTPRFEIGWRYDGGDAETGLGVDIGGGLVWWAPAGGITAEIEVRRVLIHEATGFNDWNVSGLVRYDPNPSSERGASVALRSSIGPPSFGTANSLLERETLVGLASSSTSDRGQLTAEAAYGFPILGGRFTGAPWVGAGLLESGRDYRVGYRISPVGQFGSHMQIGIEGMRRENDYGDAVAEHAIGLRFALGW